MPRYVPYLPAGILALGVLFVMHTRTQVAMPLAHPLAGVLGDITGYQVRPQTVSAEERRIAGMTDYVARAYERDSAVAFTTLVSYYDRQTQGKTIHSPRNCLPGAGWEILSGGARSIRIGTAAYPVNRFVLKNGPSTAVAYYWYQGRGRVVASEYAVKWNLLRDATLLGHTEEALVRVVVPVRPRPDASPAAGFAYADSLGTDVVRRLMRDVMWVLPGGSASSASGADDDARRASPLRVSAMGAGVDRASRY